MAHLYYVNTASAIKTEAKKFFLIVILDCKGDVFIICADVFIKAFCMRRISQCVAITWAAKEVSSNHRGYGVFSQQLEEWK